MEAKNTSCSARMYYLVQYMAVDVKELMQSGFPMDSEEGYREARRLLAKAMVSHRKLLLLLLNVLLMGL